jgi:hypothetical protein
MRERKSYESELTRNIRLGAQKAAKAAQWRTDNPEKAASADRRRKDRDKAIRAAKREAKKALHLVPDWKDKAKVKAANAEIQAALERRLAELDRDFQRKRSKRNIMRRNVRQQPPSRAEAKFAALLAEYRVWHAGEEHAIAVATVDHQIVRVCIQHDEPDLDLRIAMSDILDDQIQELANKARTSYWEQHPYKPEWRALFEGPNRKLFRLARDFPNEL